MIHIFEMKAQWKGGLGGSGSLASKGIEVAFSVPKEIDGPGLGTNPEELLLAAAASCFLITLGAILERIKMVPSRLTLRSEIEVTSEKGLKITRIRHFPTIHLPKQAEGPQREALTQAIIQAEHYCIVANALRGNVTIEVTPEIQAEEESE